MSIVIHKGGEKCSVLAKSSDSARVHDSSKVHGNCQKVYTDCKDVITGFKAKKEANALRRYVLRRE